MLLGAYRFHCRLITDAILPPYKGSTFRGVFGHALKKVVCALKRKDCRDCMLKSQCVYAIVFETPLALSVPENAHISDPPHPFVIQPPLETDTDYPKGAAFDFNLLLFGNINHHLAYFIYAFEQMGRIGIGRKTNGKRGLFVLETVSGNGHAIYDHRVKTLSAPPVNEGLQLRAITDSNEKSADLTLQLQTPLRLKFKNRLNADLPFHVLVRAMLRRISSLCTCYGNGEPDLDYPGLVKDAGSIKTKASDLQWCDWRRYSFRQESTMLMGGLVGSVTYKDVPGQYLPLIEFCEKVHLGKQTVFGLGQMISIRRD